MSKTEDAVLLAWAGTNDECNVFSFTKAAVESGIERHKIRRSVRALARKGLLYYVSCSWDSDDGTMCGAGYAPTSEGYAAIETMVHKGGNK